MRPIALLLCLFIALFSTAQIISGPMLGPVELRDAKIWIEVAPFVKDVRLIYNKRSEPNSVKTIIYKGQQGNEFNPICLSLGGFDINTTYDYGFLINGKKAKQSGSFSKALK